MEIVTFVNKNGGTNERGPRVGALLSGEYTLEQRAGP